MASDRSSDLLRQLAHAEAAHAVDRELLRQALEALESTLEDLQTIQMVASLSGMPPRLWAGLGGKARKLLSSPEAKRAMEEQG